VTRVRKGEGIGAGTESVAHTLVSPRRPEKISSRCLYISGVITLAAAMRAGRQRRRHDDEPERPAWQNDHDSASHSAFLGIFSTTAQARSYCVAWQSRQRRPKHDAWHHDHDSPRAHCVLAKSRCCRCSPIICICRPRAAVSRTEKTVLDSRLG
jgi:hypothetical protein